MPALLKTENETITCKTSKFPDKTETEIACSQKACFASWEDVGGVVTIIEKGCSMYEQGTEIGEFCLPDCLPYKSVSNNTETTFHSCCCTKDLCNQIVLSKNISYIEDIGSLWSSDSEWSTASGKREDMGVGHFIFPAAAICIIIFSLCCNQKYLRMGVKWIKSTSKPRERIIEKSSHDIEIWTETETKIHEGKYGKVFLGQNTDKKKLCIKEFNISTSHGRRLFLSEVKCHVMLKRFSHQNVVKYFGITGSCTKDPRLALEYCSLGSLRQFLRLRVIDVDTCIRISRDITAAVAFLHGPFTKGSVGPLQEIVHRDITSNNFLVRNDRTVVVSDFGLSLTITDGTIEQDITAVGTPNYMAPEILKGTINLKNFTNALKQADVYSTALVLWEVMMRCYNFYESIYDVPNSTIPYEIEQSTGLSLYDIIVTRSLRPKFFAMTGTQSTSSMNSSTTSLRSKDSHLETLDSSSIQSFSCATISSHAKQEEFVTCGEKQLCKNYFNSQSERCLAILKQTIEESWDMEEESRLTASAMHERVLLAASVLTE